MSMISEIQVIGFLSVAVQLGSDMEVVKQSFWQISSPVGYLLQDHEPRVQGAGSTSRTRSSALTQA